MLAKCNRLNLTRMQTHREPQPPAEPVRARIATWETAFSDPSGAGFATMAVDGVTLEGSVFPNTISGRDQVFRTMSAAAALYTRLGFVFETVTDERTYMEWEAEAFGLAIAGVTVLSIDPNGWVTQIALHHRPLAVVERFSHALKPHLAAL